MLDLATMECRPISRAEFELWAYNAALEKGLAGIEKTILTIGYRQGNAEELLTHFTGLGMPLADIRRRAGSRFKREYNLSRLKKRFVQQYCRLKQLGNENYPHKPFVLVDQEDGLEKAISLFSQKGHGIILMCACADWRDCHRAHVADLLLERLPAAQVIHIHGDGQATVVRAFAAGERGGQA